MTHTHTLQDKHAHIVQRNSPPNYLVSLGADSSKRTENKKKKGGGEGRKKRKKRRGEKNEHWEKKGTAATLK